MVVATANGKQWDIWLKQLPLEVDIDPRSPLDAATETEIGAAVELEELLWIEEPAPVAEIWKYQNYLNYRIIILLY